MQQTEMTHAIDSKSSERFDEKMLDTQERWAAGANQREGDYV